MKPDKNQKNQIVNTDPNKITLQDAIAPLEVEIDFSTHDFWLLSEHGTYLEEAMRATLEDDVAL